MIYTNSSGTSKPSFQIGAKGVSLASSAVISDPTHILKGYKKVTATYGGRTESLVYDIEIPNEFVENCVPDPENPNLYILTLYNRTKGARREVIINAGLGNSGVAFSGEGAVEDNLASFSDETGRYIKDSGYSVYASNTLSDECKEKTEEVPTVSAVYNYVGEITDYLKNRLNGKF